MIGNRLVNVNGRNPTWKAQEWDVLPKASKGGS
jgi:hypothetical protein